MKTSQMLQWIENEFQPLQLATPPETVKQFIENALRYYNTHSALPVLEMIPTTSASVKVELPLYIKNVSQVWPASSAQNILLQNPWWVMLGIAVMDSMTADIIQLAQAFNAYSVYINKDFKWTFVNVQDTTQHNYLMLQNTPPDAGAICVVGMRRFTIDEDINSEHVLDWLLPYVKALTKIAEGNTLRKSGIIGVKNDGAELVSEGKEEKKELEERLAREGRWASFAKRC